MVTQTLEAIYQNWKIELMWEIKTTKAKLYILVIDEEKDIEPIFWSEEFNFK